ncbi:hypothetical protein Dimus_017787 [Dionaea muscipula]
MNRGNYPGGAGFRRTGAYAPTGAAPNHDRGSYCPRYPPPNYVIELRSERRRFSGPEVERLISQCTTRPNRYEVFDSGIVAGRLFFDEWSHALDALVQFWEWRFLGDHDLLPDLSSKTNVASYTVELNERLTVLFVAKINGLIEGEIVKRWEKKLDNEIRRVSILLKRRNRIMEFHKLKEERDGLFSERKLIDKRLREFKLGLECIINHLEGKGSKDPEDEICLFQFEDDYDWSMIFRFIIRECRRLDAGLPIYAFRREILDQIINQQASFQKKFCEFTFGILKILEHYVVVKTRNKICTGEERRTEHSARHGIAGTDLHEGEEVASNANHGDMH